MAQFNREAFEADGNTWLVNHYECAECNTSWDSEWSCACDDDCPECGTVMTPQDSTDISDEFADPQEAGQ